MDEKLGVQLGGPAIWATLKYKLTPKQTSPPKVDRYGVYGDLVIIYPQPYFIYFRGEL